jgi:hypothetical protein
MMSSMTSPPPPGKGSRPGSGGPRRVAFDPVDGDVTASGSENRSRQAGRRPVAMASCRPRPPQVAGEYPAAAPPHVPARILKYKLDLTHTPKDVLTCRLCFC